MHPDYRATDLLKAGLTGAAVVERWEQQSSQARQHPPAQPAVIRRPFAEMAMPVVPDGACPRDLVVPSSTRRWLLRR